MKKFIPFISLAVIIIALFIIFKNGGSEQADNPVVIDQENKIEQQSDSHPFYLESLRNRNYDSEITVERKTAETSSYTSYVVSYPSDGNKLYSLMTVPKSVKPQEGFPVIILNHGYIPPAEYSVTNSYPSFPPYYAQRGYLVFKPDYRGHDQSEGEPVNAHLSHDYVVDVLNLLAAVKKYGDANPDKIGMWGHSNGGSITLRAAAAGADIKASVLFAGVVASPQHFWEFWQRNGDNSNISGWIKEAARSAMEMYGTPQSNPDFWNKISPYTYIDSINHPVEVHHGTADDSVPVEFSTALVGALQANNKQVEYFEYANGDHNLAGSHRGIFLQRTVNFFDRYLKN